MHRGKSICVVIYGIAEMIFSGFIYTLVQVISSLNMLSKRKQLVAIRPHSYLHISQVLLYSAYSAAAPLSSYYPYKKDCWPVIVQS